MDGVILRRGGPGGGVDVSDTTATVDTVLEGFDFYDSSGNKRTGVFDPSSNAGNIPSLNIIGSAELV